MLSILFLHGLESGPHGTKYHTLSEHYVVVSPNMRGMGLKDRVDLARTTIDEFKPDLVVGSSYGGVAAVVATMQSKFKPQGMILLAPAIKRAHEVGLDYEDLTAAVKTIVIHDKNDAVVPIGQGAGFAARTKSDLILAKGGHRLSDSDSLNLLLDAVEMLT